ncbi:hypothetical protein ACQP2P_16100 [Dactylosporangium sp. CA-139114]|uniref:hypothetical protein n=1 Tax=Dactylosporangium sp. CA-139114 TaxID=3239931 RepID=UPI003D966EB5
MTRPLLLLRAAAAILVAAAAGVAVPAAPAMAGTSGYCPDSSGVTVVVDFHELGGGVVIRCAPGAQDSGLTALQHAGFTVAGTTRWGLAFICRIEGKPTAATEPCIDTPPATAYWSYWHAPNGGTWTYSQLGVKNRTPPQGSFDGWSFSKNHTEGTAPTPGATPTRPAPPPPPATTSPPQSTGGATSGPTRGPGPTTPAATTGPAASTPAPSDTATALGPQPSASATAATATATAPSPASAPPGDVDAVRTAAGVPVGTLAGIGLLVVLAAVGGFTVWRRRRAGPDT